VYDALVEFGMMTEPVVAKTVGLQKGKALAILQNLGSKGLAYITDDEQWYAPTK